MFHVTTGIDRSSTTPPPPPHPLLYIICNSLSLRKKNCMNSVDIYFINVNKQVCTQ